VLARGDCSPHWQQSIAELLLLLLPKLKKPSSYSQQ